MKTKIIKGLFIILSLPIVIVATIFLWPTAVILYLDSLTQDNSTGFWAWGASIFCEIAWFTFLHFQLGV